MEPRGEFRLQQLLAATSPLRVFESKDGTRTRNGDVAAMSQNIACLVSVFTCVYRCSSVLPCDPLASQERT